MTAKELLQAAKVKWEHAGMFGYFMSEDQMRVYADQLCKEQREKCFDTFAKKEPFYLPSTGISILNAPMPEI